MIHVWAVGMQHQNLEVVMVHVPPESFVAIYTARARTLQRARMFPGDRKWNLKTLTGASS